MKYEEYLEFSNIMSDANLVDEFASLEASVCGCDANGVTSVDKAVAFIESQLGDLDINTIPEEEIDKMCNKVLFPNNVSTNLVSGEKVNNMVFESSMFDEDELYSNGSTQSHSEDNYDEEDEDVYDPEEDVETSVEIEVEPDGSVEVEVEPYDPEEDVEVVEVEPEEEVDRKSVV